MKMRLLVGMASVILLAATTALAQNKDESIVPAPAPAKQANEKPKKLIVEDTRTDRKTGKVIEKTITVAIPVGPEDRWFPGMRKGDPPSRLDTLATDCTCCKECRTKIVEELTSLRDRLRSLEARTPMTFFFPGSGPRRPNSNENQRQQNNIAASNTQGQGQSQGR